MEIILYNTFFTTFWYASLLCFFIDFFFPSFRVNSKTVSRDIIVRDYAKMLPLCLFNLISAYPFFFNSQNYITYNTPNALPVWQNCGLWLMSTDVFFYTIHYMFHNKYLYYYHKIHHTYKYTYGMGAIYAHPIEFFLANLVPVALPMFIFGIPLWLCDRIVFFATFYTITISHGGFKTTLGASHLNHHLKFKYNYGLLKMDKVMGTKYLEESQSTSSTDAVPASTPPALLGPALLGPTPAPRSASAPPAPLGKSCWL